METMETIAPYIVVAGFGMVAALLVFLHAANRIREIPERKAECERLQAACMSLREGPGLNMAAREAERSYAFASAAYAHALRWQRLMAMVHISAEREGQSVPVGHGDAPGRVISSAP